MLGIWYTFLWVILDSLCELESKLLKGFDIGDQKGEDSRDTERGYWELSLWLNFT